MTQWQKPTIPNTPRRSSPQRVVLGDEIVLARRLGILPATCVEMNLLYDTDTPDRELPALVAKRLVREAEQELVFVELAPYKPAFLIKLPPKYEHLEPDAGAARYHRDRIESCGNPVRLALLNYVYHQTVLSGRPVPDWALGLSEARPKGYRVVPGHGHDYWAENGEPTEYLG